MTTTPYTTESAAELDTVIKFLMGEGELDGVWFGEKPKGERGNFWWRKHLRAAKSQQAAPGVAGERSAIERLLKCPAIADESDEYKDDETIAAERYARRILASQPHPTGDTKICPKCIGSGESGISKETLRGDGEPCRTCNGRGEIGGFVNAENGYQTDPFPDCAGDTQQEAVAYRYQQLILDDYDSDKHFWCDGWSFSERRPDTHCAGRETKRYIEPLFTHPPEATALAKQVKDKAVEICDNEHDGYDQPREGWDMTNPVHAEYAGYQRACREIATKLAAIPIPEPRPDALVAMAYRKAAEYAVKFGHVLPATERAILNLTPPDAQAALEELIYAAVCAGQYAEINDSNPIEPQLRFVARATLNQQNGKGAGQQ